MQFTLVIMYLLICREFLVNIHTLKIPRSILPIFVAVYIYIYMGKSVFPIVIPDIIIQYNHSTDGLQNCKK